MREWDGEGKKGRGGEEGAEGRDRADDGSLETVDRKKDNSEKGGGVDKCESLRLWEERTFSILQHKSEPTQRSAGNQYL